MNEVILINESNQISETTKMMVQASYVDTQASLSMNEGGIPVRQETITSPIVRRNLVQREKNLLIGNSRYIEPRDDIQLIASVSASEGLHLPQRPVQSMSYDWITLLLLVSLGMFSAVKTIWGKYMSGLFQAAVNYPTALRMYQEKNTSLMQGAFLLDLLFYLIFSVFLFQVFQFFRVDLPYQNFSLYLFCFGLVLAFLVVKKTIYRIIGILIRKKDETGEYLYNIDNYKRVAGLIIIPLVAVIAFYPYRHDNIPVFAGIAIVGIIYFFLILRGFKILLKKQFSIFYLFLYFCTLELLPLVLLYKILVV